MSATRPLSSEEVLEEARRRGVEISERTLKYYVSQGLLPRPGRHPSDQADKRILFFPADVVDLLEEIRRLKSSGLTLQQIRTWLAGEGQPDLRPLLERPEAREAQLAEKVLGILLDPGISQAWKDFLDLPAQAGEKALQESGKELYRRVLSALVGSQQAERIVARTFSRLSGSQWEQKLAPLRQMRRTRSESLSQASGNALARTLTAQIQALGQEVLEGGRPQEELSEIRTRIARLASKYRAVPESSPQRHEIARFMSKALEVFGEAVWLLEEALESRDLSTVDQAFARSAKAGRILDHLEAMVSEKRELLRLCQEEDLRLA